MSVAVNRRVVTALSVFCLAASTVVVAFQARTKPSRFDPLVVFDPARSLEVATVRPSSSWDGFLAAHGPSWSVHLDKRTGAPLLVEGPGIPWELPKNATVESLAASIRAFIAEHRDLLQAADAELSIDRDATAALSQELRQVVFSRVISGIPVVGERYVFVFGHGRLIAFGASRWSPIDASPVPRITASQALERLTAYMGLTPSDRVTRRDNGSLQFIALRSGSALVRRFVITIGGEPETWEAQIDAQSGAIVSFTDINDYGQVKGGIYPVSNDQLPPDGVELTAWPMPFADVVISGAPQSANSAGIFECAPGGSIATTTLAGPYVKVQDICGPISQSATCESDLDLQAGAGTDCAIPPGGSAGDTHAARTGFYHLNRISEHGRSWLPSRAWLSQQLVDNVNMDGSCNAFWNGASVNFLKSGNGCGNTGEIAGIFLHEWGHGLDENDGGGFDNPSEAYADITSFLSTHVSCIGRGFTPGIDCSGYGDTCLNCTGIRDLDYTMRVSGTPATPSVFVTGNCGPGGGPCGKEPHCEGYVGAETLWDLATRDLPASGLDPASSWQLADKLWYTSRLGSGGNAYNCALPNSDGCAVTSWFTKLRLQDDDDGNLANGTPHAAAIFAAFNRHRIACGNVGDASNRSTSSCTAMGAATLSSAAGSAAVQLSWTPVPSATGYHVLRNDASCASGSTIIATVTGSAFIDTGLANGFAEYYAVQAVSANPACDGPLSNCRAETPQPFAGLAKFDAGTYNCQSVIHLTVTDANIGATTTTVTVTSTTETTGETITLTRVAPASPVYAGVVATTVATPAGDGMISVGDGDTLTATYVDANDGQGGINVARVTNASIDCAAPVITDVAAVNVTGNSAAIVWDTHEPANSRVRYGPAAPPGSTVSLAAPVLAHAVSLNGLTECTPYLYAVESTDAAGNTGSDTNAGGYYAFSTGRNMGGSTMSTGGPIPIPDDQPAGASSTIVVTENKPVHGVKVGLNLTHTFDGDLVVQLVPPAGAPIVLSNQRGATGQGFVNTVFDDAAPTAVADGAAPFTGSFRPDMPLSLADGIAAAGSWQLRVIDTAGFDTGTIDNWTLTLAYPAITCGPHASVQSHVSVADTCRAGGTGSANSRWDPGERVTFKLSLNNDGQTNLTHAIATVTSSTAGVVMVDRTASFPDMPQATVADSLPPYFTAYLPQSLTCGGAVSFDVAVTSDQGSFNAGSFSHGVGNVATFVGTALNESFAAGIPGTWTVVNGGSGGGPAATWTTANPGARTFATPLVAPVAIVDSDSAGSASGVIQDEKLITPTMNLLTTTGVTLQFDQYFRTFGGNMQEAADVDVRSAATGGAWVNVLRQQGADSANPDHRTLDITALAAGTSDAQVRFHYYDAHFEWWWQLDNVKVGYVTAPVCTQSVCASPPGIARPVPDGSFGTAMTAKRLDASGSAIVLTWDVATCSSADHHLLYGNLTTVAAATVGGAVCDLGTSGSATWPGVPAGNLWFVVVGDDNAATEASWGQTTAGQLGGVSPSNRCGMTSRDHTASCP